MSTPYSKNGHIQERKTLPPLLDEFRLALEAEIEAASRNAASDALPLLNGKLVGKAAFAHQYAFKIDTVLNAPSDTPGDLVLEDGRKMPVKVVTVEGLSVVVSVEEDLGEFVAKAFLRTDLSHLMRKLIARIEDKSAEANPAGDRMLGNAQVIGQPIDTLIDADEQLPPNAEQIAAIESALGRNLTAIWGPPGTGKTHTIGRIVHSLFARGRTALIVSHTNTAVDQAILKVAETKGMEDPVEAGAMLRIGTVSNHQLRNEYPGILVETQVERRSEGLHRQRKSLNEKRGALEKMVFEHRQQIDLCSWLPAGKTELDQLEAQRVELAEKKSTLTELSKAKETRADRRKALADEHQRLSSILEVWKREKGQAAELQQLTEETNQLESRFSAIKQSVNGQAKRIEVAERIQSLRNERRSYPSMDEQNAIVANLRRQISDEKSKYANLEAKVDEADRILAKAQSLNFIARKFKSLPNPHEQQTRVNELREKVDSLQSRIAASERAVDAQETKLTRIVELDSELTTYQDVGTAATERRKKSEAEAELAQTELQLDSARRRLSDHRKVVRETERELQQLQPIPSDPKKAYTNICDELARVKDLPQLIAAEENRVHAAKQGFQTIRKRIQTKMRDFGAILDEEKDDPACVVQSLSKAYWELARQSEGINSKKLEAEVREMESQIRNIHTQVAELDEKLSEVERLVINRSTVVGCTLTKAYLSDQVQSRSFDTVILDEASMAPIPALWVAASLATENLVFVGDFKQLPPICISKDEVATRWLGMDIFKKSGIQGQWEGENHPDHFVALKEQYRMRPEIADIANLPCFYGGLLKSEGAPKKDPAKFLEWFNSDWVSDQSPVCLVDTSGLNAWVTSIPRGDKASRLNFMSATLCVDLAEQLLAENRPPNEGGHRRVLIINPYRPHAKLVKLLIDQNSGIREEVESGTAHSFQGSEAPIVIFDLVVDEPQWRTNLFTPKIQEDTNRILNVAMTRACQRLIIVGDLEWCGKKGKDVTLGRVLLPELRKRFPVFSAKEIIPNGLAGRAANAQMTMLGGAIEPETDRLVVTQTDFFRLLANDIDKCQTRLVIYSPFLTQNRVSFLLPQIQAAIERGVAVSVVTKSHSDRREGELRQVRMIEKQLREVGVFLLHKKGMHEKIVLLDDNLTWLGSLNPLSHANTQEVMERRCSESVQRDYVDALRVDDLVGIQGREEAACPVCGSNMLAREGNGDPFFWQCENDNCKYTRSIGQPYPRDGLLRCQVCDGELEYGEWGGRPSWRCVKNRRHHKMVHRAHLRLPKMASLIPPGERRKLFREFDLDGQPNAEKRQETSDLFQGTLDI